MRSPWRMARARMRSVRAARCFSPGPFDRAVCSLLQAAAATAACALLRVRAGCIPWVVGWFLGLGGSPASSAAARVPAGLAGSTPPPVEKHAQPGFWRQACRHAAHPLPAVPASFSFSHPAGRPAYRALHAHQVAAGSGGRAGRPGAQGGRRHAGRRAGGGHLQPHRPGEDAHAERRRRRRRTLCSARARGAPGRRARPVGGHHAQHGERARRAAGGRGEARAPVAGQRAAAAERGQRPGADAAAPAGQAAHRLARPGHVPGWPLLVAALLAGGPSSPPTRGPALARSAGTSSAADGGAVRDVRRAQTVLCARLGVGGQPADALHRWAGRGAAACVGGGGLCGGANSHDGMPPWSRSKAARLAASVRSARLRRWLPARGARHPRGSATLLPSAAAACVQ